MSSVRILHASDLHLADRPSMTSPADHLTPGTMTSALIRRMWVSSHNPATLLDFASFIHKEAARGLLDAVLFTGDIATTGLDLDLAGAFDFINAPADPRTPWQSARKKGIATLSAVKRPIWLMPGNHDRYERSHIPMRGYVPGGTEFDNVFQKEWQVPGKRFVPPIKKFGLTVTVIAADMNLEMYGHHEGIYGWLGQGKAYGPILNQLEAETKQTANSPEHCVIWAVHFPPAYPRI